jgi:hypothetical protein
MRSVDTTSCFRGFLVRLSAASSEICRASFERKLNFVRNGTEAENGYNLTATCTNLAHQLQRLIQVVLVLPYFCS